MELGTSTNAHTKARWASPSTGPSGAIFFLPVALMLLVIASESTRTAGAGNTLYLLLAFIQHLHLGAWFIDVVLTNQELRKLGHMTGYGMLGLLTARGYLRAQLARAPCDWSAAITRAASMGILCAGLVGSIDEWHQSFLPGRNSSINDVAIDMLGAVVFVLLFRFVSTWNRRHTSR